MTTSPRRTTGCLGAGRAGGHCRLNHAGWHVVVATNQPGLGRGLLDVVALNAIHTKMHRQMAAVGGRIDAVFYCPTPPKRNAAAASPPRACWSRFASAMAWSRTRCAGGGQLPGAPASGAALGASCTWCAPAMPPGCSRGGRCPRGWPAGIQVHASPGAMGRATVARNAAVAACSGTVGGGLIL